MIGPLPGSSQVVSSFARERLPVMFALASRQPARFPCGSGRWLRLLPVMLLLLFTAGNATIRIEGKMLRPAAPCVVIHPA